MLSLGAPTQSRAAGIPTIGKRVALVMGNDAYQNVGKLEKAGNDASAMARELRAAGFEVTLERDLNFRSMVKKVDFFTSHITGGDQVVIFFAGHGVQLRSGSYLLPTDIEANSESEVEKTAISLNDVMDKLSEAKASFSLVMVDACRDNPLKSSGRSLGASRGLLPPDPPKGQMVVYSASKGQQALDKLSDKDGNPNGVFTREFIARMRKPGVRIEDLVREVQDSVEDLAKSIGHDQRPALYNEARGNFYFFGPTTVQVQQPSQAVVAPIQSRTKEQIEDDFWDSIRSSTDASGFEEYLKGYPKGRYAVQARVGLAKVKADAKRNASVPAVSAFTPAPVGVGDAEAALWQAVDAAKSPDDYEVYVKQYPRGRYVALAKQRLQKLADQATAKAQSDELSAWQTAEAEKTVDAYKLYVKRYPTGQYAELAKPRLQKLVDQANATAQAEEKQKREVARMETIEWNQLLEKASDSAVVQAYFERHPGKLDALKGVAQRGDVEAQGQLARIYVNGWGVAKNYVEGAIWANKAADQRNSDGQSVLGVIYLNGFGVAKDELEGARWLRMAAEQGNIRGQRNLGNIYANGTGVAKDAAEAVRWYRKVAEQGDATAQVSIGRAYEMGQGVTKDEVEAVKLYRKAADQGYALGQSNLGVMYADGRGVAKDEAEAVKWYRKAAEQGNALGQANLGVAYANGKGVSKDSVEAVKWFRKAAEQGNANSQLNLGRMYEGGFGVSKDKVEAIKWFRKAADQGDEVARVQLMVIGK